MANGHEVRARARARAGRLLFQKGTLPANNNIASFKTHRDVSQAVSIHSVCVLVSSLEVTQSRKFWPCRLNLVCLCGDQRWARNGHQMVRGTTAFADASLSRDVASCRVAFPTLFGACLACGHRPHRRSRVKSYVYSNSKLERICIF